MWTKLTNWLLSSLASFVKPGLERLFSALGGGIVTFTGMNFTLDTIESKLLGSLSGLEADVLAILSLCGFGTATTIVMSAYVMRFFLNGFNFSSIGKFIIGGGE